MSSEFKGFVVWVGDRAYFRRGSQLGYVEIGRLRCLKEDLLDVTRRFDSGLIKVTEGGLWVYNEDIYKRLITFCGAVSGMRKRRPASIEQLKEVVVRLDPFSLLFWYSEFVERYRKRGVVGIRRVSRALRELYYVW